MLIQSVACSLLFCFTSPCEADPNAEDIIDEALNLFRANVLFRNFEIKGDADRVLIYLILFITECLGKLARNPSLREAEKILSTLAVGNFAIPGDATFPLNALYASPTNKMDAGKGIRVRPSRSYSHSDSYSGERSREIKLLITPNYSRVNPCRPIAPVLDSVAPGDGCATPQPHL